jgi:hypothetical protein
VRTNDAAYSFPSTFSSTQELFSPSDIDFGTPRKAKLLRRLRPSVALIHDNARERSQKSEERARAVAAASVRRKGSQSSLCVRPR